MTTPSRTSPLRALVASALLVLVPSVATQAHAEERAGEVLGARAEEARAFRRSGEIGRRGRRAVARTLFEREGLLRPETARPLWLGRIGRDVLMISTHSSAGDAGKLVRLDLHGLRAKIADDFSREVVAIERADAEQRGVPDARDRLQPIWFSLEQIAQLAAAGTDRHADLARDSMAAFGDRLGRTLALAIRKGRLPADREIVLALDGTLGRARDTFAHVVEARVARSADAHITVIGAQ